MKRLLGVLAVLVAAAIAAGIFFFWPARLNAVALSPASPRGAALVERGRYLATAADCVACHTAPNGQPFAGGLAFRLPFGTIYSSNITPDRATGIGSYSDAEFVRAMRHGVRKDGQQLYPAFPYTSYAGMSDDDVLAIRAWLATLPPVRSSVQPNGLKFPFNQRWLMRGWNLLFFDGDRFEPSPARPAEWNRGAYLVEVLGHCGECHTPRNLLYGFETNRKFAGETTQGWTAYNITSDQGSGIGAWSADEIVSYLGKGHAVGRGVASGTMAEAVEKSLSHLTPADLRAMATYIQTIPAKESDTVIERNPPALARATAYSPAPGEATGSLGLRIYEGACASCHGWDGSGLQSPYAALRGLKSVNDPEGTNLIQIVLRGNSFETESGRVAMPGFGKAYSDAEVAAVANYVLAHFGNKPARITPADVADARKIDE